MSEPTPEKLAALKTQFPDRSLHQVDLVVCGTTHTFVMTGPSTDEHKKLTDEMIKADDMKDRADKISAVRGALLRGALAQIRWPERIEVQSIFDHAPEAIDEFNAIMGEHAGRNAEVRTKNL